MYRYIEQGGTGHALMLQRAYSGGVADVMSMERFLRMMMFA